MANAMIVTLEQIIAEADDKVLETHQQRNLRLRELAGGNHAVLINCAREWLHERRAQKSR